MKGDRNRIPLSAKYRAALGQAVVCFARCEWAAAYCCEALQTGYIATIEPKRKMAGTIADDLVKLVSVIADANLRSKAEPLALAFQQLVKRRNRLLHGKPMTGPRKQQRLSDGTSSWSITNLNDVADEFAECGIEFNDLYHQNLK